MHLSQPGGPGPVSLPAQTRLWLNSVEFRGCPGARSRVDRIEPLCCSPYGLAERSWITGPGDGLRRHATRPAILSEYLGGFRRRAAVRACAFASSSRPEFRIHDSAAQLSLDSKCGTAGGLVASTATRHGRSQGQEPRLYETLPGRGPAFSELSHSETVKLYEFFRPEVEKLEAVLNRDLSAWKHPAEPVRQTA
jgi:hypothetical protein